MVQPESDDTPRWIDLHSIDCILCGGLADERETVKIQPETLEGMDEENRTYRVIEIIMNDHGTGEAHHNCFEVAKKRGVKYALANLEEQVEP